MWTPRAFWQDLCRVPLNILHAKHTGFRPCGFREEDLFMLSYYKPLADNDAPLAWPI